MDDGEDEHVPFDMEKLADSSPTIYTGATEKAMAHEHENEHVSIDIKRLADGLSRRLETLHPSSNESSIYRVAEPCRPLNPSHYPHQMVSIGPFHHGKPEVRAMEEHKQRYLKCFLQRTVVCMKSFLSLINDKEAELRDSYAEFVTMVLVDAVFLIEFFLRRYEPRFRTDDDRIFAKHKLQWDIEGEPWLVENQLPLFILIDLFDRAKETTYKNISFSRISCSWLSGVTSGDPPTDSDLFEMHFYSAKHLLDLIILCLQQHSQSRARSNLKDLNIPTVQELHQAGVKFKPAANSTRNLLNVAFDGRILEIPSLTVYASAERLFRNLLTFERTHDCPKYFNDYIIMMSCLVKAPKDAELLIRNGIIRLGATETLLTLFSNNLNKECVMNNGDFQYNGVVAKLQAYR